MPLRPIPSPTYRTRTSWISYFVERSNSQAATLAVAGVLAQGVETVVSPLTIAELWWGIFDALYNRARLEGGGSPQRLTPGEYRRSRAGLLERYAREVRAVREQLHSWPKMRGVAPRGGLRGWSMRLDGCIDGSDLLPSDAVHVALASRYARSLITNDRGLADSSLPVSGLTVIVV